jgi:predicted anti-sigma-YlaC factor YlaD
MTTSSRPSCDRTRALLSRQLDAGLSELERRAVDAHTERCSSCRNFAAEVTWFTEELRRAPLVALPQPVSVSARRRFPVRVAANLASAAALVAVAVGGVSLTFDVTGERGISRALVVSPQDGGFGDAVLREFRRDALRAGELPILPVTSTPSAVKPALPATDA